jgi:RNA polymerase sigma-70 factor (ECF subfamily)
MDEGLLLERAKRGDLDAFNRLVLSYQSLAYNLAYRIIDDPEAAADATQEAFIAAFRSLRSFRGGSFRAWVLRIVTNACYDELRRRKRRPSTSLDALGEAAEGVADEDGSGGLTAAEEGPESAAERRELTRAIQRCIDRLPADYRTVVVLVDVQGFDYQEAAEVVSKPLGTVKSRLARARARLRDCLQAHGELLPGAFRLQGEGL